MDALIALEEWLPRLGDPRFGGSPPSRSQLWVGLVSFGLFALFSAGNVVWYGATHPVALRWSGWPGLSLSLVWVGWCASGLLREGNPRARRRGSRLAVAAVLTAATWLVFVPAFVLIAAAVWYATAGVPGVLGWVGLVTLLIAGTWLVGRYSGPMRGGPGR